MKIERVGVIGSGIMGAGIAQVFAASGFQVTLQDVVPDALEKAGQRIRKSLDKLAQKGKIDADAPAQTMERLNCTREIDELKTVDFVVEAIVERSEVKKELFGRLDGICRAETILGSNTSSISITEIAAATRRPEQVIGMHFMNPVPIMKLVEVIRGLSTSDATTGVTLELCHSGLRPVGGPVAAGRPIRRTLRHRRGSAALP